jgi:hypothetical protein
LTGLALSPLEEEEYEALTALGSIEPTTTAGVLALLRYLAEIDAKQGQELCGEYHDDGDPAVSKRHGAPSSQFFARSCCRSWHIRCLHRLLKIFTPGGNATHAEEPRRGGFSSFRHSQIIEPEYILPSAVAAPFEQ